MVKCYRLYDFVEWDGENIPAVSTLTNAFYGEGVEYSVAQDGSLDVSVPGYPPRNLPVGGILVLNPNLDQYLNTADFESRFGIVAD